jgi:hypothetical protein
LTDDSQPSPDAAIPASSSNGLISRVLAPAVRLWLRSQLESVENLELHIQAGDRQLLSGTLQQVSASASKAVYRGLHFSTVQVSAEQIQTNLRQVVRGKPFRLLAAFPVAGSVKITQADLNASVSAPLLATALCDFLSDMLQRPIQPDQLRQSQINLNSNQLQFVGELLQDTVRQRLEVCTTLEIKQGNKLKLGEFRCQMQPLSEQSLDPQLERSAASDRLPNSLIFPLGSDVHLEDLTIQDGTIYCQGQVKVMP